MPLIRTPALQYVDTNGVPCRFAKAYFTETGTTTPVAVYEDKLYTLPHDFPVVADSQGLFPPIHVNPALGLVRCRIIQQGGDLDNPMIDADPVNELLAATVDDFGDVILTVTGHPTTATPWLGGVVFVRALRFPALLTGSRGKTPKVLPTADYVVTIKVGGTSIGTATCSHLTGLWTIVGTSMIATNVDDGGEMDFYGPASIDAAMADFGLTIKGSVI